MKKFFCLILIAVSFVFLCTAAASVADAPVSVTPEFLSPTEKDYAEIAPDIAAGNANKTFYVKNDKIYMLEDKDFLIDLSGDFYKVFSIDIYNDFLFVNAEFDGQQFTRIYCISDTSSYLDETDFRSVAVNGDSLYVYTYSFQYDIYLMDALSSDINDFYALEYSFGSSFGSAYVQETFAAEDNIIYSRKNSVITKIDYTKGTLAAAVSGDYSINSGINNFVVNNEILYGISETAIYCYDADEGHLLKAAPALELLSEADITLNGITATADGIFISYTSALGGGILKYSPAEPLKLTRHITGRSTAPGRFNSPASVTAIDGTVYIADKDNNRITTDTKIIWSNIPAPYLITAYKNTLTDETYEIILYYACSMGIYSLNVSAQGATPKFISNPGIIRSLSVSAKGELYYETALPMGISISGETPFVVTNEWLVSLNATYPEIIDVKLDYCGNVFLLNRRDTGYFISYFKKNVNGYDSPADLKLNGIIPTSLCLSSDYGILLTSKGPHAVMNISNGTLTDKLSVIIYFRQPDFDQTPVNYLLKEALSDGAKIFTVTKSTYLLPVPTNYEVAYPVSIGTELVALYNGIVEEKISKIPYYYVYMNGEIVGYIPITDVEENEQKTPSYTSAKSIPYSAKIYKYPFLTAPVLETISRDTIFTLVTDAGNYDDSQWYQILFNGEIGYIERTACDKHDMPPPPETPTFTAKIRAPGIGAAVRVYASEDAGAAVKASLTDGTMVTLVNGPLNYDELYTYIQIGDIFGYVETQYLTTQFLTTAQITALVILGVVAVITVTLTLIFVVMKKKRAASEYSDD